MFPQLFPYLVFLHVLGAILAFGPTFAYSIIAGLGRAEPMHANFAIRAIDRVGTRLVYPLAIFQGITGVLIILSVNYDVMSRTWLLVAIVLYLFTLGYALTVQRNAVHHMIELTSTPPAPGTPPSPEIPATGRRIAQGGILLGAMIVIIVFLMVVKPGS